MSKSEVELRKQAELRMWNDRIEALKQAGLMPELTESVIGLIQEKVAKIEEEKVAQAEDLPEPSVRVQSSSEDSQKDLPKTTKAQQAQREELPAPASNPMLDFLADLSDQKAPSTQGSPESQRPDEPSVQIQSISEDSQKDLPKTSTAQQAQREEIPEASDPMLSFINGLNDQKAPSLPELPKAPKQDEPSTAKAAKEPTEPAPEAKPAIPSVEAKGAEPLQFAQQPESDEPKINFNDPDATGPIQSGRVPYDVPIRTQRQPYDVPIQTGRQPYDVPKREPEDQPIISGRQPYDVPKRDVPEQKIQSVTEPYESPSISIGNNVQNAIDALNVGSSEVRGQDKPEQPARPATPMSPSQPPERPKQKQERLQDRRDKAMQSKPPVSPDRLEPGMLERYRQIQAQQSLRDDSSEKIGGGFFPNATAGGTQETVYSQQDRLAIASETANSQLGMLLERLAREHANLVIHIREANRILDESQY